MPLSPRTLRPANTFTPRSISGLALWLDASASGDLYTTDAGPVVPVSSPTEISGCVGWWDASDLSTMRQNSDGTVSVTSLDDPVGYWADKSGNGRHARQSTSGRRPLAKLADRNGLAGLNFDGSDDFFLCDSGANFAAGFAFAVVRRTGTPVAYSAIYAHGPTSNVAGISASAQTFSVQQAGDGAYTGFIYGLQQAGGILRSNGLSFTAVNSNLFNLHHAQLLPNTTDTNILGVQGNINSTVGTQYPTIGLDPFAATRVYPMRLYELIVFDTVPSLATIARVEAYLAAKWGISGVHAAATSASDPVGYWRDRSGNGRHAVQATGANRVTVGATTLNGRRFVAGGGDLVTPRRSLSTPSWNYAAGNTALFVFNAAALNQAIYQRGTLNDQPRAAVQGAPLELRATVGGVSSTQVDGVIGYAPASWAIGATLFNTGLARAYRDGAFGTATTSNTQTWATSTPIRLFSLTDTLYGLNGGIAEFIYYDRQLSNAEVQRAARYLAAKWGITLAPQVSNADAQNWIDRVYANGGTVTSSTAAAVNQFCLDIENAPGGSLRDRFYRLNLFAGTGLNACLVPLYRGQSLGGTQFGNTTDTNNGPFLPADYSESSGLTGNGSTKWLNTGFLAGSAGLTTGSVHLSAVWPTFTQPGGANTFPVSMITANAGDRHWINVNSDVTPTTNVNAFLGQSGSNNAVNTISSTNGGVSIPGGLWVASRTTVSDLRLYLANTERASQTATIAAASISPEALSVFARWNGTAASLFFGQRMMGYSVGLGMSSTQVAAYNAAMVAFNTAMSRSV